MRRLAVWGCSLAGAHSSDTHPQQQSRHNYLQLVAAQPLELPPELRGRRTPPPGLRRCRPGILSGRSGVSRLELSLVGLSFQPPARCWPRRPIVVQQSPPHRRRPPVAVPSAACHAYRVSSCRLAIKSCHDWRGGGTCPAGIGDCGCSCGADTSGLRKTPVSNCGEPPLIISSFCPGGVGAADGEPADWGEDDLRARCCCR